MMGIGGLLNFHLSVGVIFRLLSTGNLTDFRLSILIDFYFFLLKPTNATNLFPSFE